ncbi:MAG: glycosyltransferase family A protein, partial [Nitrososphaerales archaeon]
MKQTLYKNIADNADADVEFVILDYNSKDDLAEWIGREMRREMEEGRVTFWQEKTAKFFHHSHAKNVAALLARGEIICNLDADNFTGPGYAKYLIDAIENDGRTVIYHAIADGRRG